MHLRVAGCLSFCVVIWHWCDGHKIPEELQKYDIYTPNTFGRESLTNKTMDQFIMDTAGGLKGANNVTNKNGAILMELDMLLTKEQYLSLYEQRNSNRDFRWTNGEIPYRFYPGHFNHVDQKEIRQAMTEWERYTCLRFREATSSDINVIVFSNDTGCYSQLGMVGGEQVVSLSSVGCRYTGLYLHVIGHAIGLVHEHQLPNRDDYVEILTEDQFTKYTSQAVDQMNDSNEYYSVMHYGVIAFFKDEVLKTIRVKYPEKEAIIGEVFMKGLSFTDVEIVNKMYKCSAKCGPNIQCFNGYVNENCRCICKNGYHHCQIERRKRLLDTCEANTNDYSWKCFVWAQQGECEANPTKMNEECAMACGLCGVKRKPGTCAKMYPSDKCLKWSRNGDCLTNTEWMNNYCCGTCVNRNNENFDPSNPMSTKATTTPIRSSKTTSMTTSMTISLTTFTRKTSSPPSVSTEAMETTSTSRHGENGIQMWVIAVIAGLIVLIAILVAVIIAMKRPFAKKIDDNKYEVPEQPYVNDTHLYSYITLDMPPLTSNEASSAISNQNDAKNMSVYDICT